MIFGPLRGTDVAAVLEVAITPMPVHVQRVMADDEQYSGVKLMSHMTPNSLLPTLVQPSQMCHGCFQFPNAACAIYVSFNECSETKFPYHTFTLLPQTVYLDQNFGRPFFILLLAPVW